MDFYWLPSGNLTSLLSRAREDAYFHWFWYQGVTDANRGDDGDRDDMRAENILRIPERA